MKKYPEMIPVAGPWITELEEQYAAEAARTAWFKDHYRFNKNFEDKFAAYLGVKHAVSLPHATAGLHLALAAKGITSGDEVIVPDVTWIASVAPVSYVGATPVFVDMRRDTWCLDVESVQQAITPRTKAIIGVDLYGSMVEWEKLRALADAHHLYLIEDAAEALGSQYYGQMAGSLGDVGVFSFHGSKTLVTGEGGMIVTDDDAIHQRIMTLRDHGRPVGDRLFQNSEIAFKYKMSAVQAALGLAQVERIDELIAKKRAIFALYKERLSKIKGITFNAEPAHTINSAWMVSIIMEDDFGMDKFGLMEKLKSYNIDTRPFFSQLSTLPAYVDMQESARFLPDPPQGARASTHGINLPSGYLMDEEKIHYVCDVLGEILET